MTGPCSHCGIRASLIWRPGPPDKPVLCYNCEIWWRLNGSLRNNNISQHLTCSTRAQTIQQENNLFPRLFLSGHGGGFSRVAAVPAGNNAQTPTVEAATQSTPFWKLWNPYHVLKKRRSTTMTMEQRGIIIFGKRLKQQSGEEDDSETESVLIFERVNKNIPENEIGGHGCMLLNPSSSSATTCRSTNSSNADYNIIN